MIPIRTMDMTTMVHFPCERSKERRRGELSPIGAFRKRYRVDHRRRPERLRRQPRQEVRLRRLQERPVASHTKPSVWD